MIPERAMPTDWFDTLTPPVHEGVYEVRSDHWHTTMYALWDGYEWKMARSDPDTAETERQRSFLMYERCNAGWRGVVGMPLDLIEAELEALDG